METVNNLAGAAAKAIWGENPNQQEPLSGELGDTSKGEPFDKGNMEEPNSTTDLDTAAAASTSKGQDDVRDPSNPQTHPKNNPADVDDTGDGPNEPQNLEGAGPKPIEEVAREHGGDAGNIHDATSSSTDQPGADGDEPTDPSDPRAKSTGEGTGEQYVKSTGMAADGGDFDATKPGAGREADRLMEEKGIHRESGPAAAAGKGASDTSVNSGGSGEKKKFTTKLKEKFHRN